MEAVLAAFTKWPPECAHSIATPHPIERSQSTPEPFFSFFGSGTPYRPLGWGSSSCNSLPPGLLSVRVILREPPKNEATDRQPRSNCDR